MVGLCSGFADAGDPHVGCRSGLDLGESLGGGLGGVLEIGFVGVLGGFGPAGLGLGGGRVGVAGGHLAHPVDKDGIDGALAPEGGDLLGAFSAQVRACMESGLAPRVKKVKTFLPRMVFM